MCCWKVLIVFLITLNKMILRRRLLLLDTKIQFFAAKNENYNLDFSKLHRFYDVLMHFGLCNIFYTQDMQIVWFYSVTTSKSVGKELESKWEIWTVQKIL